MTDKDNTKPLFSIIVTAYNQEDCLDRAIKSVLEQSLQDFELIVVDDCSTDGTVKLIKEYADKRADVKLIRHDHNSSSHAARMTGVKNAAGKYILFLDGDDYFFPDALERLNEEVIKEKSFDVCEFAYVTRPDNKTHLPQPWDKSKARIEYYRSQAPVVNVWNKLYTSEVLKKAFSNMQEGYIRTGDDTYESICTAYFTENYIQAEIPVLNYLISDGISFKLNTWESNLVHAKSLNLALRYLKEFLEKTEKPELAALYKLIEGNCYNWFLSVIKDNTVEKDVIQSFTLIPQYFPSEYLKPYIKKLYAPHLLRKKIKKLIPSGLRAFIRKIIK